MIKKILSVILVLVWMGLIFSMSCANGKSSGGMSRKIIVTIVETVSDIKDGSDKMEIQVERYQLFVRKAAHFIEYSILAFLVMNMLYTFQVKSKTLLISAIICILYAASDEIHQLFVNERAGSIIDAMWDSSASLLTSYVFYKLIMVRGLHERKSK